MRIYVYVYVYANEYVCVCVCVCRCIMCMCVYVYGLTTDAYTSKVHMLLYFTGICLMLPIPMPDAVARGAKQAGRARCTGHVWGCVLWDAFAP